MLSGKAMMTGKEMQKIRVCPFPFYQMFIHTDGTVVPCCADWQRRLPLGNVKQTPLPQIWSGKAYNRLCIDMLKTGRSCREVCEICKYPETNGNDNIDAYAGELLPRYTDRDPNAEE